MKEIQAKSFEEIVTILGKPSNRFYYIFRGQSNAEWKLLPKIGRKPYCDYYTSIDKEKLIFESWKRYAVQFVKHEAVDDLDWLTIAQHHNLATRLLDWTKNPLIALFFAVHKNENCDVALFSCLPKIVEDNIRVKPFEIKELVTFYPRGINPRIVNQRGLFTISPRPCEEIENSLRTETLTKIIIPKKSVHGVLQQLDFFGINEFTLFPDLIGLSNYLNNYVVDVFDYLTLKESLKSKVTRIEF